MSGGSGGGSSNQTSTQVVDLPDWAKGYAKEGLGKAAALTDTDQNPYQQYGGDRQAEFTGLQNQAFTGAQGMGASPAMGTAANMAGTAGLGALNAGANFNPYQTGQFTGDTAQNYMNPYMQNVVDIQKREAQRTADIAGTGRNAQAVKSGAFGGSRQAIMDAEANRNLATQMGDIQARGSNAAFQQAQQQFNTEQALGEQSRQFGNTLGMQGFQTALTGAGQLANIGQQTFGQEMDVNKLQQQYGTQQQAFNQQGIDTQYQDFLNQQRYPYQQLEFMNSMLRGTPMGTVQSMYQPAPSGLSQLAGLGTAAYGVSQMAEGGEVPGYAVGGGITGLLQDGELQQRMQSPTISKLAKMAAEDEMHARAQMRAGAAAQQAPQGEQPTVADEYMMSRGVAALPSGEINMAGGGILAFAEGATIPGPNDVQPTGRYQNPIYGGTPSSSIETFQRALESNKLTDAERAEARAKVQGPGGLAAAFKWLSTINERKDALDTERTNRIKAEQREGTAAEARSRFAQTDERLDTPGSAPLSGQLPGNDPNESPYNGEGQQDGKETGTTRSMAERVTPTRVTPKPVQSFEDILARLKGDPNTRQAIIDQVDLANVAKEDVFKQGIANLKRDQDDLGEFGTEREKRLKKQEEGLAGLEKRNQSMAFIEAGLAMMSGNSANAFENIGKGALVGTKAYKAGMEKLDAKRDKLDEAFMNLYDLRRGEKVANKKDLRAAETAYEAAKADSTKIMADLQAKFFDGDQKSAAAATDAYTKLLTNAADIASRENVANIGATSRENAANTTAAATLTAAQIKAANSRGLTAAQRSTAWNAARTEALKAFADPLTANGLKEKGYTPDTYLNKLFEDQMLGIGGGGQGSSGDSTMDYTTQGQRIK